GSLTVWFSPEAIRAWTPDSDVAVQTALHLRLLLGLPWRQTEGLLQSLMELVGLDLEVPDHTTLSRRSRDLATDLCRVPSSGPIHLIVDASGLKVFGQSEWAAAKYGCRRMGWRKLHLAVDEGGRIVAAELTDNDVADATVFPTLLNMTEGKIDRLTADGAYDRRDVYDAAGRRGAYVVVPPQRGAVISGDPILRTRDRHIRRIARIGRAQWRREKGQHRQARAENTFYRYKRIIGSGLRARHPMAQRNEMLAACNLLNRMSVLGMPSSQKLVP
ncbi:MAG: IS5 family transposase, partial [Proteobacteria bacterium]|nr:IS5 family transposase [Pseudomonadota bacterium]